MLDERTITPRGSTKPLAQALPSLHLDDIAPYVDDAAITATSVELHFSHRQGPWDHTLEELSALPCFTLVTSGTDGCQDGTQNTYL